MNLDRGILFRTAISIALALGGLAFFLAHRSVVTSGSPNSGDIHGETHRPVDWQRELPAIDVEVDSALSQFGIQKWWIKKKLIPVPDASFSRVERRVEAPKDLLIVDMNTALNTMAHRYDGRAVASENSREHLVTIHIELGGFVVQTLIIHPTENLPPQPVEKKKPARRSPAA